MSTSTPYFLPIALATAWQNDLDAAVGQTLITAAQKIRFGNPVDAADLRLDLLQADRDTLSQALAGAVVLSDSGDPLAALYLHTPLFGLERFKSRHLLNQTLGQRCPSQPPGFELVRIDNGLHETRMKAIVDARMTHLRRQAEALQLRPIFMPGAGVDASEEQLKSFWTAEREYLTGGMLHDAFCRALLQGLHDNVLSPDEMAWLRTAILPPDAGRRCKLGKLSLSSGEIGPVKLAGVLLLEPQDGLTGSLFAYVPGQGMHRFTDRSALLEWLGSLSERTHLAGLLSLDDQRLLATMLDLRLRVDPVTRPLFHDRADSLIGLYKRNVATALTDPSSTVQTLYNAQDIGALIDNALKAFTRPPSGLSITTATGPASSWIDELRDLERQLQTLAAGQPSLATCASHLLGGYLAAVDLELPPADAILVPVAATASLEANQIQTGPAPSPVTLTSLLLNHFTGHQPSLAGLQPIDTAVLPNALLSHILLSASRQLKAQHRIELEHYNAEARGERVALREQLLRLALAVERRTKAIDTARLDWLQQVLDYPRQKDRQNLPQPPCEVHTVQIGVPGNHATFEMAEALVIQPTMPADAGVLFWSARTGLSAQPSLPALLSLLQEYIAGDRGDRWLEFTSPAGRLTIARALASTPTTPLRIGTRLIEVSAVEHLETLDQADGGLEIEQAWERAVAARLPAPAFTGYIDQAGRTTGLDRSSAVLGDHVRNQLLIELLPGWLKNATTEDLLAYLAIIVQLGRQASGGKDFLFDIPSIQDYARAKIRLRLTQFQFNDTPDPDTVMVSVQRFVVAPAVPGQIPSSLPAATLTQVVSLTDYMLTHFSKIQGASLKIHRRDGRAAPPWLTPVLVRSLSKELDIGGTYQALLARHFDRWHPEYRERQALFLAQLPAQLQERALEARMSSVLTPLAHDFIEAVLTMPDGLVRLAVQGHAVTLRQLALIAEPEMKADPVTGIYLLGPLSGGPIVLYAMGHEAFVFREFVDPPALLLALRSEAALQALVLARMDKEAGVRYAHGGFSEPHLPFSTESSFSLPWSHPGPAALSADFIKGNALIFLFEDCLRTLQLIAKAQSVTRNEADWAAFTYLMGLGLEQGTLLLPGKFAVLMGLWQTSGLAQVAVTAAGERRWGEALAGFSAALGCLAASRAPVNPPTWRTVPRDEPVAHTNSWNHSTLSAELRQSLETLQSEIALVDLVPDPLLKLYISADGLQHYAPVQGKVYQLRQIDGQWQIVKGEALGPTVNLDALGQWQLDLKWGLKGGGGVSSHYNTVVTDSVANSQIIVTARGMPAIRLMDRNKGREIGQAHSYAKRCLETCVDNLSPTLPAAGPAPETLKIISDFFGVPLPSPELLEKIRRTARTLLGELADPSLSPHSSPRFVVGVSLPAHRHQMAFVVKNDPQRRIYLTDLYFDVPVRIRRQNGRLLAPFDVLSHSRASGLIHELSHLALDTQDIDYLESAAPFPDLLSSTDRRDPYLKSDIERIRTHNLSVNTPWPKLFKREMANGWQDLSTATGDVDAKKAILKISGRPDLEGAREVFFRDSSKRADIMLANADSVTVLLMTLGRKSMTSP